MLTSLPVLVQVIAIVIWASFFFLLVNAPMAGNARDGRGSSAHDGATASPASPRAKRGRPSRWNRDPDAWGSSDLVPINNYRNR